jgi:hypothetical protein
VAIIEMVINVPVTIVIEQLPEESMQDSFQRAAKGLKHWAEESTKHPTHYHPALVQSRVIPAREICPTS